MTNLPPPPAMPPAAPAPPAPHGAPNNAPNGGNGSAGFGGHALVALLIGIVFLYFGWPAVSGLLHPSSNPYGMQWSGEHPQAGQPVPYFQVEGGTAWRDIGALATGIVLLAEAAAYGLMNDSPGRRQTLAGIVMALGIAGCAANALSAVMQYQSGFHDLPLYAVIGLILCLLSVTQAKQLRA